MSNPMKAEVPLALDDGRTFVLTMDHAALFDAEQASGVPLARLMAQGKLGFMGPTRHFLLAGLKRHHPEMTIEEASAITLRHFDQVDAALVSAMKLAFPDDQPAEGKKGANPPKAPRTGKRSGASGAKSGSIPNNSGKPRRARSR